MLFIESSAKNDNSKVIILLISIDILRFMCRNIKKNREEINWYKDIRN